MAFAAAMPVADPEAAPKADPGPFLYSLTNEFATIPFDPSPKKRDVGPPSKVIRDPYLLNKNNGPQLTVTFTPKNKRQLSNIRPLLTRSPESFLTERTLPSTPTEGTDARKCGAVAGYTCHSGNGACCGGAGSGHEVCSHFVVVFGFVKINILTEFVNHRTCVVVFSLTALVLVKVPMVTAQIQCIRSPLTLMRVISCGIQFRIMSLIPISVTE